MRSLFFKECKKVLFSLTFFLFAIIMVLNFNSQYLPEAIKMVKPSLGQESYGSTYKDIPEVIMPAALSNLYYEYFFNNYTCYPIGFYKNIKLNDEKQEKVATIITELSGMSRGEIQKMNGSTIVEEFQQPDLSISLDEKVTYERFLELMNQADDILGGGSNYSENSLVRHFGNTPKTYEEALSEYDLVVEKDRFSGAYARLFCDYLGIVAAFLPLFIAVGIGLRDKRHGMNDLIAVSSMSSFKIIIVRYLAMLSLCMVVILGIATAATIQVIEIYPNTSIHYLDFFIYSIGWIMPSIMAALAVGMFLTLLTDTPISIMLYGLYWFLNMFVGMEDMEGGYGSLVLAPRHNILGNTKTFIDNFNILIRNRMFFVFLSLGIIIGTTIILEQKRKGKLNVGKNIRKLFIHNKSKFQA